MIYGKQIDTVHQILISPSFHSVNPGNHIGYYIEYYYDDLVRIRASEVSIIQPL